VTEGLSGLAVGGLWTQRVAKSREKVGRSEGVGQEGKSRRKGPRKVAKMGRGALTVKRERERTRRRPSKKESGRAARKFYIRAHQTRLVSSYIKFSARNPPKSEKKSVKPTFLSSVCVRDGLEVLRTYF